MKIKPLAQGVFISAGGVLLAGLAMAYLHRSVALVGLAHSGFDS